MLTATKEKGKRLVRGGLDMCADRFRANPNLGNAMCYRDAALEYWEDEMIGDESLLAVLHEIRASD